MKHFFLALFVTLFLNVSCFAQGSSYPFKGLNRSKNHISIDPLLPIFGSSQVQFERQIANQVSVSLAAGIKFSSGIIEVSGIKGNKVKTNDFNFRGYKFIPEFRWYLQKNQANLIGFYAGAYFKYSNITDDIVGVYTDDDLEQHDFEFGATIRNYGGGLELGYKLQVKKRFFIDFLITGPGIAFYSYSVKEVQPVPEAFYDEFSKVLSDYGILKHIDTNINFKNQSGKIILPSYRYGLKIGYAF